MDLEAPSRTERESRTLLQDRVRLLETDKVALTRSACDLRNQLEAALESQSALRKSLAATQASEQSLSALNVLLESRLRTAQNEVASYQQELRSAVDNRSALEAELTKTKEDLLKARGLLVDAGLKEQQLAAETQSLRERSERTVMEGEYRREQEAIQLQRLQADCRESERQLRGEIERIREELAAKTAENDHSSGLIADLTVRCDDLAAQLAFSTQESADNTVKLTEALALKDTEISELKERSGLLPLLNFPTESKEQVHFLTTKLTDLHVKYARATTKAETFEKQLRLLLEEVEAKGPLMAQQRANYEELCEAYSALKASVEIAEESANSGEVVTLRERLKTEMLDNDYLREEVTTLSLQVRTLLIEVHRLRYGGEDPLLSSGAFRSLEELQKENQRLHGELRRAENGLQGRNEDLLEKARLELIAQRTTIDQLTQQLQVSEDLLQQGYVPTSKVNQLMTLQRERENQLKLQVANYQADLAFAKGAGDRLQISLEAAQKEVLSLREDLRTAHGASIQVQSRASQIATELAAAQETIKRLQNAQITLQREVQSAKDSQEKLQFETTRLREKYEVGSASALSLHTLLQEQAKSHREEIDKFISERETIYAQWRAREQELADIKKNWRDEVSRLKADIENLKAEIACSQALFELEDQPIVVQYRLQVSELKTQINDLQDAHEQLLRSFDQLSGEHARALAEIQLLSDKYQRHRLLETLEMTREEALTRTVMYHETLTHLRIAQKEVLQLSEALKEAQAKVEDLENSLAREKTLFLQETTHTSQLQTAILAYISKVTEMEADFKQLTTERDTLAAGMAQQQKEWSEAQSISSGNFQYIREFQGQISKLKREKVDLEVKYKELADRGERERGQFVEEKATSERVYRGEVEKLERELGRVKEENVVLREGCKGLDPGTRKALERLTELQYRLFRLKP